MPGSLPHRGEVREELPSRLGEDEWEAHRPQNSQTYMSTHPGGFSGMAVSKHPHLSLFLTRLGAQGMRWMCRRTPCEGWEASPLFPPSPGHLGQSHL